MGSRIHRPKRLHKYLDGAPKAVAAIYDKPGFHDRFSVCMTSPEWEPSMGRSSLCLGLNIDGGSYWCEAFRGPHLGKLIHWKNLPDRVREGVVARLK
jgi:hypothetical protein